MGPSRGAKRRDGDDGSTGAQGGKPGRKAFLLRLPPELMEELRGWSAQEFRSLNAHIEYLLRQAVKRRRGGRSDS